MKGQCVIGSIIDVDIVYKDDTYSGNFTSLINNLKFNILKKYFTYWTATLTLDRDTDVGLTNRQSSSTHKKIA